MLDDLRALTLWPEWSYGICYLGKKIENRTWYPNSSVLNRWMAIHAGKHIGGKPGDRATEDGMTNLVRMAETDGYECYDARHMIDGYSCVLKKNGLHPFSENDIVKGAIVCLVKVLGGFRPDKSDKPWAADGMVHWYLGDVIVLDEPIYTSGKQGLWRVDREHVDEIRRQVGKM